MQEFTQDLLNYLQSGPLEHWVVLLLLQNLVVFLSALALGALLKRKYAHRIVTEAAPALGARQILWATSTISLNTLVTFVGLLLWREGIIRFRTDYGLGALLDLLVLTLVMDLAMYFLHRIAHHPWILPWMHQTHHNYPYPRPIDLFVLNPFEVFGFGGLWLVVVSIYPSSWLGMTAYLSLNVLFGTIGHLGVEPFAPSWARHPLLRWLGTSTFHALHHQTPGTNFGFYTIIWDRLLGTLHPEYIAYYQGASQKQALDERAQI